MFYEAARCRKIVTDKNYHEPLSQTEIYAATRIKLRRNLLTREFAFEERPFRKQWIMLLESVGETCPPFTTEKPRNL